MPAVTGIGAPGWAAVGLGVGPMIVSPPFERLGFDLRITFASNASRFMLRESGVPHSSGVLRPTPLTMAALLIYIFN